jgi:hypothetical protein
MGKSADFQMETLSLISRENQRKEVPDNPDCTILMAFWTASQYSPVPWAGLHFLAVVSSRGCGVHLGYRRNKLRYSVSHLANVKVF